MGNDVFYLTHLLFPIYCAPGVQQHAKLRPPEGQRGEHYRVQGETQAACTTRYI